VPLTTVSARTLPFVNGTCVLEFQTSDPASFAASAPTTLKLDALGAVNERPILVEVSDTSGTPQFVFSWVPGFGGSTWIHPGLSDAFVGGGFGVSG
jgi:hypothetical protein